MGEKLGSDILEEAPKKFGFHGNPWEVRTQYRQKILKLLTQNPDKSYNASEVSQTVECSPQTGQLILLEMALEGLVHVQMTKSGYSKLFRINLSKLSEDITQIKPRMTFDYRSEEET